MICKNHAGCEGPFQERKKRLNLRWLVQVCNSPDYRRVEKLTIIVKLIAVFGHVFYISDEIRGLDKRGGDTG